MKIAIITIFLAVTAFGFFLKYLTYSRRNAPLPDNVKDVFDAETYARNQAYKMEKLKFSIISGLIGTVVALAILLFNVHHWLYSVISVQTSNMYLTGLFIFMVPLVVASIIDMVVGIYDTFVIEEKFGFNKSTAATYILDFVKMMLIVLAFGAGLLSLFLLLYDLLGNWVFLAFFFVLIAFQLFISFITPLLIRVIYKLTPLEDGELKQKIEALAKKTGYKLKGIYMVDASKRSAKLNAFAAGVGKTKTIGLFDTLVEKMSHDEIIAILAHEIGHNKLQHILKRMPLEIIYVSIIAAAAYFVVALPQVSQAFGFVDANVVFGVYVLFIMFSPIDLVLDIPSNALSRKHEYEADAYAKKYSDNSDDMADALKKIYKEDLGNLTPHPFVVMMEYTHPPLSKRLAALEK